MPANKKEADNPATTSFAHDFMLPRWALMSSLLGGTQSMRVAGEVYLPRHDEEKANDYEERLNTNVLFNMTELTLETLVGKPFSDPIIFNDDVPDKIKEFGKDIDLQGNNIDVFGRRWFREGLAKSFAHVLIDMPIIPEGEIRTLEDDRRENLRPYFLFIEPEDVIFAASQIIDGKEVLTHIRIKETEVIQEGFTERIEHRIRVLEPGFVQIWRLIKPNKRKKAVWVPDQPIETSLKEIPFVTFYTNREGFMVGKPPLTDLAYLNVTHWQSNSDQRNILTVGRFPMLALSGGDEEENAVIKVGPRIYLHVSDAKAKYYYVEPEGKAIEAGERDLKNLEEQMAAYGAQFLKRKPGKELATVRLLDSMESMSPLQSMTISFKDAMETALGFMAKWLSLEEGAGTITMHTEFLDLNNSGDVELAALDKMRQRRDISRETHLEEAKRFGVLSDTFDAAKDAEKLANEPLPPGGSTLDLDEEGGESEEENG